VATTSDVVEAFARIHDSQSTFISRGDESGTHQREKALWAAAGITPRGTWYQSVGQGMGATLTVASEQQAYTLSDKGTYLSRQPQGIELSILLEGDDRLYNPYGVMAINPALHSSLSAELAQDFIEWLVSDDTQAAINQYRVNGQQLFYANALHEE